MGCGASQALPLGFPLIQRFPCYPPKEKGCGARLGEALGSLGSLEALERLELTLGMSQAQPSEVQAVWTGLAACHGERKGRRDISLQNLAVPMLAVRTIFDSTRFCSELG